MGFSASLAYVLFLCCVVNVVVPHDPWDFAPKNPVVWGPSATTSSSVRQPSGPSLGQSSPWAWLDLSQPRALSSLQPVTVQCREAQVVVSVNRDLFGTGRLIQAADLTLGIPGCQPTSFDAAEDAVIFEVGLHECGNTLQMTLDSLVYSISLYYNPNSGNPVVIRTSPAEVPIECHYPRKDNVSSKVIKPTWVPFSSSISAEQKLTFSLRLMNGRQPFG
ncbi:hypothetical protein JD844_014244 [Phrynosoma platyrhinos]|uniref:Zona pellucida sperm-binding protein 3 n=1 Tax=Phrynosoma platyrhinos TaxID=52577 RepID=A0ABQ7SR57_PHRPL|nr:hypothetical protein JD844_014244 [Phrynosoma platyrhinos]